mmetsp:Transcript_7742/g.23612  ORF Transcript_7742/g.23612 Transcript_7742/m.23612 type:complete len:405 (-) Transcript_7742:408-1622(-)
MRDVGEADREVLEARDELVEGHPEGAVVLLEAEGLGVAPQALGDLLAHALVVPARVAVAKVALPLLAPGVPELDEAGALLEGGVDDRDERVGVGRDEAEVVVGVRRGVRRRGRHDQVRLVREPQELEERARVDLVGLHLVPDRGRARQVDEGVVREALAEPVVAAAQLGHALLEQQRPELLLRAARVLKIPLREGEEVVQGHRAPLPAVAEPQPVQPAPLLVVRAQVEALLDERRELGDRAQRRHEPAVVDLALLDVVGLDAVPEEDRVHPDLGRSPPLLADRREVQVDERDAPERRVNAIEIVRVVVYVLLRQDVQGLPRPGRDRLRALRDRRGRAHLRQARRPPARPEQHLEPPVRHDRVAHHLWRDHDALRRVHLRQADPQRPRRLPPVDRLDGELALAAI